VLIADDTGDRYPERDATKLTDQGRDYNPLSGHLRPIYQRLAVGESENSEKTEFRKTKPTESYRKKA
jgi:hypothetical protein